MQGQIVARVVPAPSAELDRLVARRRLTGYTVEVDTSYLHAVSPTLTCRMYAGHTGSARNLDLFCTATRGIGAELRASRAMGTTAVAGRLVRTDQICVRAAFEDDQMLRRAVVLVEERFTCRPGAVPGSWRFPDVRIRGGAPPGTIAVWAHQWGPTVALAASPVPPVPDGTRASVRVLARWADLLTRP
jgi:hypothetical protein